LLITSHNRWLPQNSFPWTTSVFPFTVADQFTHSLFELPWTTSVWRMPWRMSHESLTASNIRVAESYVKTDGQSASLSCNKVDVWSLQPDFYCCQRVAGLLIWGALSDDRTGLSFTIAPGFRQRSHFRVRVPWDTWPYITVSDPWLPFSLPPTTRRVTVEVFDPACFESVKSVFESKFCVYESGNWNQTPRSIGMHELTHIYNCHAAGIEVTMSNSYSVFLFCHGNTFVNIPCRGNGS
jgi:hypothetical protein